MNIILIMSRSI